MFEVELKLAVPQSRLAEVKAQACRGSERVNLDAVYFDTADGRLSGAGLSLRMRHEGKRWLQTLKAPTHSTATCEEDNVQRTKGTRGEAPALDAALHRNTPAGHALIDVLKAKDLTAVQFQEKFRTEVVRNRRVLLAACGRVELALDEGRVLASESEQPIRELEFELKSGSTDAIFALARPWIERHGLWIESRSKAVRGTWLSRGEKGGPPVKALCSAPRDVRNARDELALLRAIVDNVLHQVLGNASEVAAGRETPDHVHQLRVGLRRMRIALRAFSDAAPDLNPCEAPLAHAFRALGGWRDAGVTREAIMPMLQEAGAPDVDLPSTDDERHSPTRLTRGKALQLALLQLMEFASAESSPDQRPPKTSSKAPLNTLLNARLNKLHKQVKTAGQHFEDLTQDEQHRTRRRLKRLRYLAEFVAPRYEPAAVKRYLAALGPAQNAMGAHNDAAVALKRYRALLATDRDALFAVGWLTAKLEQTAIHSHHALKMLDDVQRFWR